MNTLVAAQVAFCFLVHFGAGLFVSSFDRLAHQPTGFNTANVMLLETVSQGDRPRQAWQQVAETLRGASHAEFVGLSEWALLSRNSNTEPIFVNGEYKPDPCYVLHVSPGWLGAMQIPLLQGQDFQQESKASSVAIVNDSFARKYFPGTSPIGKSFEAPRNEKDRNKYQIVGVVGDVRYENLRDAIRPTIFLPLRDQSDWATFTVRTPGLSLAPTLRNEISKAGFHVINIQTQQDLIDAQTVRERLLALLSVFFAIVALVLAAVGLYGVLTYSVLQRQREIGIRIALGAMPGEVARQVTWEVFAMLILGALIGMAGGVASERFIGTQLYQVRATDWAMLAFPSFTIFSAALAASLPAVLRALRIDPAAMLRAE